MKSNDVLFRQKLKLQRVLSLMLNDITVDYDVVIETVRPHGMQQLVDFYALSKNTHTPLSATLAYQKLTSMGPNFHYPGSDFIFVKFEMKGLLYCSSSSCLFLFLYVCLLQCVSYLVPVTGIATRSLTNVGALDSGWKTPSRHTLANRRQTVVRNKDGCCRT